MATNRHGLVRFKGGADVVDIYPNGPANNSVYRMSSAKGSLYVTTGAPSGNWGDEFRKDGIHYLVDGRWATTDLTNDPLFASGSNDFAGGLNDVMPVQVDPEDGTHAFVSQTSSWERTATSGSYVPGVPACWYSRTTARLPNREMIRLRRSVRSRVKESCHPWMYSL